MVSRGSGVVLLVAAIAAAGAGARAAGLREVGDGYLAEPADTVALLAAADGRSAGPASGVWFAAGQARLWGLPDLPLAELAAGVGWGGGGVFSAGGAWHRTGDDLLRVDRLRSWMAWHGAWTVRLEGSRERAAIGGEPLSDRSECFLAAGPDLDLGPRTRLRLRIWAELSAHDPDARRLAPAGDARLLAGRVACVLAWDRWSDGTPALGAELGAAVSGAAALTARWDGASGSLGPGLALRMGPLLLRTAHLVHPALGPTHRFELTAGALGAARR